MEVLLTEDFVRAVDEHLAAHPPERMLHALGRVRPDGSVLLSHWVADADADASGAHVRASAAGEAAVQAAEREHGLTYLGVVHSHPASVPEPSGQDGRALADLLALNPHIPVGLVGVVVSIATGRTGAQVLDVGRGELVLHTMTSKGRRLTPAAIRVTDRATGFWSAAADRLPGEALEAVREVHVTLVGAGSLGSVAAEQMVRAGVPRLTLIDPDRVEAHNLTRTTYQLADVGRFKVDALADRLHAINPEVSVDVATWAVDPSAHAKLSDIVADSSLVLGLADAPRALALLDAVLHEQDTPGIFAGVYRAAVGADVITVLPGITACYRCTVAPRVEAVDLAPGIDYTTGRISGAVALGADVALVGVLAARLGLAVLGLLRGTDPLLEAPALQGRNFLQVGLAPGFFDDTNLFAAVPGQHAIQTLWARAAGDPDCDRCGHLADATVGADADAGTHSDGSFSGPALGDPAAAPPASTAHPAVSTNRATMRVLGPLVDVAVLTGDLARHRLTHVVATVLALQRSSIELARVSAAVAARTVGEQFPRPPMPAAKHRAHQGER